MRSRHRPEGGIPYDDRFTELAAIAHRVAYRILGSAQDAEEVAQEALTKAYLRWPVVAGHAEPWVARVATNLALGRWRKAQRARDLARPADTAAEDHLAALRLDLVRSLEKLPKRQREVVVMRYLADRSERETAEALGCSVGAVKQHAHRALASLRTVTTLASATAPAPMALPSPAPGEC